MNSLRIYKRHHKIWFFSFLVSNVFVFALLIIANPYRLLPFSITIPGINDIKPKLYEYQRYVKLFDIAHVKPKTVLLGSSRILWGVDPKNPLLQQEKYLPVYNVGVLGPPMYEIRKYFDHALISQPHLKRVILGIDFFAFNHAFDGRNFPTEKSFAKNEKQLLKVNSKLLFDLKAVLLTLKSSMLRQRTKTLREDGRLTPAPLEARELYKDFFPQQVEEKTATVKNEDQPMPNLLSQKTHPKKMRNVLYGDFKISQDDMDAIRYIIKTCEERQIELYIFFTPVYEIPTYYQFGLWEDYKYLLREIAKLHPYWNFVSWNSVTKNKENYVDGSHFIFSVGDMIIKKMFHAQDKNIPDSFGRYTTANNVDQVVLQLENEYDQYLKNLKAQA